MDNILDLHGVGIIHDPLVHIQEMILPFFCIVLGVGLPRKAEIVIFGNRIACPTCIHIHFSVCFSLQIRQSGIGGALHNNGRFSILHMVFRFEGGRLDASLAVG